MAPWGLFQVKAQLGINSENQTQGWQLQGGAGQ